MYKGGSLLGFLLLASVSMAVDAAWGPFGGYPPGYGQGYGQPMPVRFAPPAKRWVGPGIGMKNASRPAAPYQRGYLRPSWTYAAPPMGRIPQGVRSGAAPRPFTAKHMPVSVPTPVRASRQAWAPLRPSIAQRSAWAAPHALLASKRVSPRPPMQRMATFRSPKFAAIAPYRSTLPAHGSQVRRPNAQWPSLALRTHQSGPVGRHRSPGHAPGAAFVPVRWQQRAIAPNSWPVRQWPALAPRGMRVSYWPYAPMPVWAHSGWVPVNPWYPVAELAYAERLGAWSAWARGGA